MTKAELVEKISPKINLTKKDTERVVNIVFGSIIQSLAQGDKVELRGFGSFRVRKRDSRDGRNPRTGDTVQIPPKKVPFFKAGKELRELVDSNIPASPGGFASNDGSSAGAEAAATVTEGYPGSSVS
ncbi:MAG: integration host factor subunit beta [bacterium]|nr:integration host factor subunit beta [bacterium]